MKPFSASRGVAVPSSRIARLARFGGIAGGMAGGMAAGAARALAGGARPDPAALLLTPANAARIARELAHLRGAAMKIGQLLSMDAGEMLPPEMAEILARLRAEAEPMPPRQLRDVLNARWGERWRDRFDHFDVRPVAAASIGQVHRARTHDGRELAIKIQYPGVRRSIDSDVANVAGLLKLSRALPERIDIKPVLEAARAQLHEEADYEREGACLTRYGALIADMPDFVAPELDPELTTSDILAMSWAPGAPVETLADAPQQERDRLGEALIDLAFRELLDFGVMQTDPNFANYRYDRETGRIALLDFGATRDVPPDLSAGYRGLLEATLAGDRARIRTQLDALGFFAPEAFAKHEAAIMAMVDMGLAPLLTGGRFDFGDRTLARQMRDRGMALADDRDFWHIPPVDALFVQRKALGMYLLATRIGARVDLRALIERRLAG